MASEPDQLCEEMAHQLEHEGLILFTGAGFSQDARSRSGEPIPSTPELVELMWPVAFPEDEPDASEIEDVFESALMADRDRTHDVLRARLEVDAESLPPTYETWFSMPWFRIYTLNVDDLDDAVQRRFELPVPIRCLSALGDELPPRLSELLCVHLNGRIAGFPAITFSHQQYGERTAAPDPWYQHLAADLLAHPGLFVGTQLDEPPLWQQFALRTGRGLGPPDRPPSYLVAPSLPVARRRVLEELNVTWIPMNQADFAEQVLAPLRG